ncbi:MAG: hypothetical protein ACI85K_003648 [Hyphomicrobiaceae bacterium]|jgi:hypothetical protein
MRRLRTLPVALSMAFLATSLMAQVVAPTQVGSPAWRSVSGTAGVPVLLRSPEGHSPQSSDGLESIYETRLEVKLAEGTGAEWRGGQLISHTGVDLSSVQRWFASASVMPMVTSVSREQLDRWHQHACSVLPEDNRPGHLGLWFHVSTKDAASCEALRQQLASEPLISHVYHQPRLYLASATPMATPLPPLPTGNDIPPTTPSFVAQQFAQSPAPLGHGFRLAAGVLGARGQGIGFRMLENGWTLGHEDLCQMVTSNVIGAVPSSTTLPALHGTSGGSVVFADRNEYGITGMTDEVEAKLIGIDINGSFGNAVSLALLHSQPGDVGMVVIMVLVSALGPGTFLPFEFYQAAFDATLTATANGLHMVVPAGNGDRSLDDPALLGRFDRNFRDSGSIIVGASAGGLLQKASFSNWGSRIDAHSWGDGVLACGYGTIFFPNSDPLQAYTASGTGTSSATPHVASVVAAIQGASLRQNGLLLSNAEVINLLHTVGPTTPDIIGRRPDVVAILRQLQAIDGLEMAEPDVALGDTISATMTGPPGSLAAIFGAFATGNFPLGFNRNIHLDLGGFASLGAFVLTTGSAQYQLPVPNNVALHDTDIYFQAVRLTGTQPLFVTNSCQATIL